MDAIFFARRWAKVHIIIVLMDCKTLPHAPVRKWESGSRGGRPAFYLYVGPGEMVHNEPEFSRLDATDDLDWLVDSAGGLHLADCAGESIEPHELEPGRFEIRWKRSLCPPPKP